MTTATSLVLIAVGAILAFAVSTQVAGINIQTWRTRHAALIEEVLPGLQTTISRAERFTAR